MGRIIAVDYGQKNTGLAVTDENCIIAMALTTVSTSSVLEYLKKYISSEKVDCIVVGKPRRLNNKEPEISKMIDNFAKKLKEHFPEQEIVRFDERFTSKIAFQTMIDAGLKKKARQNKELIDKISATLILQSYLESISNKNNPSR